jgi:hypothetical protein
MELINATRMVAGCTMGTEPSGRDLLVVVIKGPFRLPKSGEAVRLHDEQLPLVMADTFTGEPGFSATHYEVDFAPRKQRCDVLLLGSAHAPQGRPATRVAVGVRIGNWTKTFAVVGNRRWQAGIASASPSEPEPFTIQPISYDVAFGGTDQHHDDPAKHAAFMRNPVGCGFHKHLKSEWVDGSPLPNTEEINRPVTVPDGDFAPMSFGPVGRGWEQRSRYAGTYDGEWLEKHFPFLPPDFDEQYYQAAPLDQQLPMPLGGQELSLGNLTPDGVRTFTLPAFDAPINVFPKKGEREDYNAALDTIVFEPDLERFTMTWRATRPLSRNLFEIRQVLVGKRAPVWWQSRHQTTFPIPVLMVPMDTSANEEDSADEDDSMTDDQPAAS